MNLKVQVLKDCFNKYDDNASFNNYETIAKKYNQIYTSLLKGNKNENKTDFSLSQTLSQDCSENMQELLKEEIKKWFFSLPIESRIKVATVENEIICKIIYQMYLETNIESSIAFQPKDLLINFSGEEFDDKDPYKVTDKSSISTKAASTNSSIVTYDVELQDGIIYPPNKPTVNRIKLTKEKKNGVVKTQTLIFEENDNPKHNPDLNNVTNIIDFSFTKFFSLRSNKSHSDYISRSPFQILDEVKFFSIHHHGFPDCMTLKPTFLLNKELFENCFKSSSNRKYFHSLIQPSVENGTKYISYCFPKWMEYGKFYNLTQYIFGFIEQAILIKFLLNFDASSKKKNQKSLQYHSLINESKMSSAFEDRKNAIFYLNNNFDVESRISIFNDKINLKGLIESIRKDKVKMGYLTFWKGVAIPTNFKGMINKVAHQPIELSDGQTCDKIAELLCKNGNINFIDILIYKNTFELWKIEGFLKDMIYDKILSLNGDLICMDLVEDSRKKKKKKKNKEEENQGLGDGEYELYYPYFVSCNIVCAVPEKTKKINKPLPKPEQTEPQVIKKFIEKDILNSIIEAVFNKQKEMPEKGIMFFKEGNETKKDSVTFDGLLLSSDRSSNNEKEKNTLETKKNNEPQQSTEKEEKTAKSNQVNKHQTEIIPINQNEIIGTVTISSDLITNNKTSKTTHQQKQKKEKKNTFFLYNTDKKPKKSKPASKKKKFFPIPLSNTKPLFFEKLHNDILEYNDNISVLASLTMGIKQKIIETLKAEIIKVLPESDSYSLDVYGSFATGLSIEASDIDIKIRLSTDGKENLEKFFHKLLGELVKEKKYESIVPISTASVPVIKLVINLDKYFETEEIGEENLNENFEMKNAVKVLKSSPQYKGYQFNIEELNKIKVDITFISSTNEKSSNTTSVEYAKEKIEAFPEIQVILRVMKRFFYTKRMNNSFNGGLSSFNLFLLTLSYAQYKKMNNIKFVNLGLFLLDFVDFFGKMFNFRGYIVDVNNTQFQYLPITQTNEQFFETNSLVILDPLTGLNASRSSFKIDEIQRTFYEAWEFLMRTKEEYDRNYSSKNTKQVNFIYEMNKKI